MKKSVLVIMVFIFATTCNNKLVNLTKFDQNIKEVVKLAITDAIVNKNVEEYDQLIKNNSNIVIYDTLISYHMLPKITGIKYELMSVTQMQQKAGKDSDFVYLYIWDIHKDSGNSIVIGIGTSWITPQGSKRVYLSGGYRKYKYTKTNRKWKSELIARFVG
jgi:hypothetical protein